jgi:hypothetical protein
MMKLQIKLDVANEARRLARLGVGTLPSKKVIPDKRRKAPRHKKSLSNREAVCIIRQYT